MKQDPGSSLEMSKSAQRSLRRSKHAFCPVCAKLTELISFDEAAEVFHTDLQDINFLAGRGEVHQVHNRRGKVMACSVSLFDCFENRRTRLLDSGILKEKAAKGSA